MRKLKAPCDCGWIYAGFHLCVDKDTSTPLVAPPRKKKLASRSKTSGSERQKLGAAARWAIYRQAHAERDRKLVQDSKDENISLTEVARRYGIAYQTARKIITQAAERGEIVMRPRGRNVRYDKN